MELTNLEQPPFDTSLMGVCAGALAYHGRHHSPAMVFGGSGHAFVINVHEELCPSSPYVWRMDGMYRLLGNLGLQLRPIAFAGGTLAAAGADAERVAKQRADIEQRVRALLDAGAPCGMVNLDNQLIRGHDANGLLLCQPWPGHEVTTPARLSFGSWEELGDEVHAMFFSLEAGAAADPITIVRDSLAYAVDLCAKPGDHEQPRYGIGPHAYANWAAAAAEHGASHGGWWNARVWSECRRQAAAYFEEIGRTLGGAVGEPAVALAADYAALADGLQRLGDKEVPAAEKSQLATELGAREAKAVAQVGELIDLLDRVPA